MIKAMIVRLQNKEDPYMDSLKERYGNVAVCRS